MGHEVVLQFSETRITQHLRRVEEGLNLRSGTFLRDTFGSNNATRLLTGRPTQDIDGHSPLGFVVPGQPGTLSETEI